MQRSGYECAPSARTNPRHRRKDGSPEQPLLFAALSVLLTLATVWGGRIWFRHSETLVFATGEANGIEARFAAKLANVLKHNSCASRSLPCRRCQAVVQFYRRP